MSHERRPQLSAALSGAEFMRWYWLKDELAQFARSVGISATGAKEVLAHRIAAHLDGETFAEGTLSRGARGPQLSGVLTAETRIPVGQRCSQIVRAWFVTQVGPAFGFDAEMRDFFAASDGTRTLQDALDHYRATRGQSGKSIDAQFEYNRFTRAWYENHPGGTQAELLHAWREYRAMPVDERGRA